MGPRAGTWWEPVYKPPLSLCQLPATVPAPGELAALWALQYKLDIAEPTACGSSHLSGSRVGSLHVTVIETDKLILLG